MNDDARPDAAAAAAATAAAPAAPAAPGAVDTSDAFTEAHNPYGSPPGSGITMPPYYQPTPSVKNKNNYFPQSEPLGPDEMRIIFMGSQPWPPRQSQAGTCIMVELGNGKRFFFDFGPGCLRNIIANQVPVPEITDIFITHLHLDHYADIPYLWQFAPFNGRWKPLRIIGPSGRTPELGTAAMAENMQKMGLWTSIQAKGMPLADGYKIDVTEFDYRDDGGICYDQDGVKVTHWRRSHAVDGASAYRLDWNGLSFVWTGDGKADRLTAKYAEGADVFVSEMAVDNVALWALKQGVSPFIGAFTLDNFHTSHYAFGYLANLVKPRLAMASHLSYDRELIGEMIAGVRTHYNGMFAFGIDHTVVNVTKDKLWIREAALPETTNTARATPEWLLANQFDGEMPGTVTVHNPFIANQEQEVRDLEFEPELFTPADQVRQWAHPLPPEFPMNTASMLAGAPPQAGAAQQASAAPQAGSPSGGTL